MLVRIFLLCIVLCALGISAQSTSSNCVTYIDATNSTEWVVVQNNNSTQTAACIYNPINFVQSPTANPPNIILTANNQTCAKAYIPGLTFGLYNCNMKISSQPGIVTSCETESSSYYPYENVYFKFFGNDTQRVYIGFFGEGIVNQAGPIRLGFDPTVMPHTYTIEYSQSYIKWYVDGIEISSEYGYRPIPQTCNRFTISINIEEPSFPYGENYAYPTDSTIGRIFTFPGDVTATFSNLSYTPMSGLACTGSSTAQPSPPAVASANCDATPVQPVYTDSAGTGWSIASSDSVGTNVANLAATDSVYAGLYSISFTPLRGDIIFRSQNLFYTTNYYSIEFWFQAGDDNPAVSVYLIQQGGQNTAPLALSKVVNGGLAYGVWTHVILPFASFGLSTSIPVGLTGFGMTFPNTQDYGKIMHIDGVYLAQALPLCANQTFVIYQSGFANYIKDNSYGGSAIITNYTGESYNGTESIRWDVVPSSGLSFGILGTTLNTQLWKAISMRVKFVDMSSNQWSMYFTSPSSDPSATTVQRRAGANPLDVFDYLGGVVPQGTFPKEDWPLIVIPLYEFGIGSDIQLDGMVVASNAVNGYQGTLLFDNVMFITDVPAAVQSQPTSDAAHVYASFLLIATTIVAILL